MGDRLLWRGDTLPAEAGKVTLPAGVLAELEAVAQSLDRDPLPLLVLCPDDFALDEACLLIAGHARPGIDIERCLGELDRLAGEVLPPTLDGLVSTLFGGSGFRGNADDYYDPDNSYLDQVLQRRLGLPITLAVLAIEVGRRAGVPLWGVSMPGHFLLRDKVDPSVFLDQIGRAHV